MNNDNLWEIADAEANRMTAEIERLRAENERLRAGMISIASGNENGETCRAALWRLLDREDNES